MGLLGPFGGSDVNNVVDLHKVTNKHKHRMDKEKIAAFLEEMIDALTFRRVALLALLATITISLVAIFENRNAVFAAVYKQTEEQTSVSWTLSNESKNQMIALAEPDRNLIGVIMLSDVDLKKNRRVPKFLYIKDKVDSERVLPAVAKLLPQALFDYDSKNTEQMVSMLNNEFKCVPTSETHYVRFFPDLVAKYPVSCRIAVPPFFGEFAGYITTILTRKPTAAEYDALKIEMNRIAIETYLRDISKKPVV